MSIKGISAVGLFWCFIVMISSAEVNYPEWFLGTAVLFVAIYVAMGVTYVMYKVFE